MVDIEKLIIKIIEKLKIYYSNDIRFKDCKWDNPSINVSFKDNHLILDSLTFYFDGGWSKLKVTSKSMSILTEDYDKIIVVNYENFSFFDN